MCVCVCVCVHTCVCPSVRSNYYEKWNKQEAAAALQIVEHGT